MRQCMKEYPLRYHVFPYRSAPDLLLDICLTNRWGEPVYTLTSLGSGGGGGHPLPADSSNMTRLFIYRVTIPNFPFAHPHNQFQSYSWRPSLEEARIEAAQFVLACLRVSPDYVYSNSSNSNADMTPHPQVNFLRFN